MSSISSKLDLKFKKMALGSTLGNINVQLNKLKDSLRKEDKQKAAAGLKGGGIAQRGLGRAFMKGGKV